MRNKTFYQGLNSPTQQSAVKEINSLHSELEAMVKTGIKKAIRIGELLNECKEELRHGSFSKWIEANCSFSLRTAQNYMKLFNNREKITAADSVTTAYSLLKNAKVSHLELKTVSFETVKQTIEQRAEAMADHDLSKIDKSDFHEKIAFWVEYSAASLDEKNIGDVVDFNEKLTWLFDKLAEIKLRTQRELGRLLGEVDKVKGE